MGGGIGGDDSVAWWMEHGGRFDVVEDGIKGTLHRERPDVHAVNIRKNEGFTEGRDPSDTDGKSFDITIEVPPGVEGTKFLDAVATAVNASAPGGTINFKLPILHRNHNQIRVDW